ncbi:hypothetical protein BAR24066_04900 [Burkholderia arboris]|uniref:Uncharacterized protein n=1 Tax=Burkholderia arboris TaxID=488730 RepID=A0A9Q9SM70_9BURK|nr:hypothetical protein BAR24066_04900 [Burkholderia arboris]
MPRRPDCSAWPASAGTHRPSTWAHALDLPEPWRRVSASNPVMTTGVGLPRTPREPAAWPERIAQTHACALVVAPRAARTCPTTRAAKSSRSAQAAS